MKRSSHDMFALALVAGLAAACGGASTAVSDAAEADAVAADTAEVTNTTEGDDTLPQDAAVTAAVADTAMEDDAATADATAVDTAWPTPAVEQSRYEADLAFIAQPRSPGSAHWQAVQDLCAERFAAYGYAVERHAYASGVNVIGTLTGTSTAAEQVVLSAHYDHIIGCAGADDNGSGVAGLFEAARVLAATSHPRTLIVACWDEEERGLLGSGAYAARAVSQGQDIVLMYDFDMIGYRTTVPNSQVLPYGFDLLYPDAAAAIAGNDHRGDFIAVLGDASATSAKAMAALSAAGSGVSLPVVGLQIPEGLETSDLLADLRRSDHAVFWDRGIPALLISDTGELRYAGYHCRDGPDAAARLDPAFATEVVTATIASVRALLAP